jgi:hypothetical protein
MGRLVYWLHLNTLFTQYCQTLRVLEVNIVVERSLDGGSTPR